MLLDISIAFQIYLRTSLLLTSDLAELAYFDYKGATCKDTVKLQIPEAPSRAADCVIGLKSKSYEDGLQRLDFFSPSFGGIRVEVYKTISSFRSPNTKILPEHHDYSPQ